MEREHENGSRFVGPGLRRREAIVAIDVLRRLNIHVKTIACAQTREVVSYHAIPMIADSTLAESTDQTFDAVILPGGPEGSVSGPKRAGYRLCAPPR
jgi:putative intracellular protease/amidase